MTVAALIKALKEFGQDARVVVQQAPGAVSLDVACLQSQYTEADPLRGTVLLCVCCPTCGR